ncbi:uncharacterized protein SETTUDRAFT_31946 [Exserohilum turcica Et28A]|uniref:DUF7587 domain-containing protein n=1 Tax=Exserohilum turcicum (strain 28A) TaxID=671987 RepID=R0K5A8_EXST2|nr:uncharacterized protein SETTUDRAFT_31946 [Exserohilum turcica Et28A]EOA84699.1 hypothetical protein SETTUDRAFT_31946 [Exserohilum turcica Et28A]
MTQDIEHLDATVFMPHGMLEGLSDQFDCIPHYLFRTSSPRSGGTTNETHVASVAAINHFDQSDILARDWDEAVVMLQQHLLWEPYAEDNLVSWTSSFIFVVQHAIRREETDKPTSASNSIYISVLDTRKVPRGTFLPARALLKAYDLPDEGKLKHDFYYGEYISQGSLYSDAISTTTLE